MQQINEENSHGVRRLLGVGNDVLHKGDADEVCQGAADKHLTLVDPTDLFSVH